jgi:hypothetical protein
MRKLTGTPLQRNTLRIRSIGVGLMLLHVSEHAVFEAEIYADQYGILRHADTGEPLFPLTLHEVVPEGTQAITVEIAPQASSALNQSAFKVQTHTATAAEEHLIADHHGQAPEIQAGLAALNRLDQLHQSFLPTAQHLLLRGTTGTAWESEQFDRSDYTIAIMIEQLYAIQRALGERESLDIGDRARIWAQEAMAQWEKKGGGPSEE